MNIKLQTQVLIIGGGATGTGLARDFALRGIPSVLVEKRDINAGASGANHGLLHSGARYVFTDPASAKECQEEGQILKKMAPHCIEDTGGLFIAVEGDDEKYIADFPDMCAQCGIPVQNVDPKTCLDMEPALTQKLIAAYAVEDASVDPFMLSLENISQAQRLGSTLLRHHQVTGFEKRNNRIHAVNLMNNRTGESVTVEVDQVVNAAGAWAGEVALLADVSIDMLYSKGSLLITHTRITNRVINRLRPPSDGDILVPGGTVSLLGTTSIRVNRLDDIRPTIEETDRIVEGEAVMVPALEKTRYIRSYAGVRPLVQTGTNGDDRAVSRGFVLLDHAKDGVENLTTITGGKLTTYRLMAEKTGDRVCRKMGVSSPCLTRTDPLLSTHAGKWTEPGRSPKMWVKAHDPEDMVLCECEMVPKSTVDRVIEAIRAQGDHPDLKAIGLRSRVGKGSCQGAFCAVRVAAYMYDQGSLDSDQGLVDIRQFLNGRWKGIRPVLWEMSLIQEELQEALHCGLFSLEL